MMVYIMWRQNKNRNMNTGKRGRQAAICLFWIAIWQAAAWIVDKSLLLPAPIEAFKALARLAITTRFYMDIGWTVFRCILAMLLSFTTGVLAAWLAHKTRAVRDILSLPVGFFKAVPVMAIIIYVILIAKSDWVAVIVCFFMCFPIVYTNILAGIDAMSSEYLEVAKVYELNQRKVIRLIYAPGLLPQIKASISLIAGLSWKAVVAAEVLSIPKYSLGYEMINSKYYLETDKLFAYILVIVALSMFFEKLIKLWLRGLEWRGYEGSKLKSHAGIVDSVHLNAPDIIVRNLSKSFDKKKVLNGMEMSFKAGKITAVSGPSGRGKTTLARIISGLENADDGCIEFSEPVRAAFLFQEDRLLPWLNIYDNIGLSRAGQDLGERILQLAKQLEIENELWRLPEELSGGMRHRAALARTFLAESNLLILDEPLRGLDENLKLRIVNRLWEKETSGKTVILITHSAEDADLLADFKVEM